MEIDRRSLYPLTHNHLDFSYWDSAATTPAPRPVIESLRVWAERKNVNVHRSGYPLAVAGTKAFEQTRDHTRSWLNAPADWQVIFTSGATESLNIVAGGLDDQIEPGDSIVVTIDAHHSLFVPLQQLARRRQAHFVVIDVDTQGRLDAAAWGEAIARRPKIVGLTHVSNVTGRIHDLPLLGTQAQATGALVIVDGAQAVSHLDINLSSLPIDAYAFSAHKMYGPTGVGVLAVSRRLSSVLAPSQFGGGMIDKVDTTDSTWAGLPDRLEVGTTNLWGLAAFDAALSWLEHQKEDMRAVEASVLEKTLTRLKQLPGLTLYGPLTPADRIPLFSFNLQGLHAHDVAEVIGQGVALRAGHHCAQPLHRSWDIPATVRASAGHYTTDEDIERLIVGLTNAEQTLRG